MRVPDLSFRHAPKSVFDLTRTNKLSFNIGDIVPIGYQLLNPGDEIKTRISHIVRFSPLVSPMMHDIKLTVDAFAVPLRILGINSEKVTNLGLPEGDRGEFPTFQYYTCLQDNLMSADLQGTLFDYFGYPIFSDIYQAIIDSGALSNAYGVFPTNGFVITRDGTSTEYFFQSLSIVAGRVVYRGETYLDTVKLNLPSFWIWLVNTYLLADLPFTGSNTDVAVISYFKDKDPADLLKEAGFVDINSANDAYFNYCTNSVRARIIFTNNSNIIDESFQPVDFWLRAYWRVICDWYMNSNIWDVDDMLNNLVYGLEDTLMGAALFPVYNPVTPFRRLWEDDYFTSLLPNSQVGTEVSIPASATITDIWNANALQKIFSRAMAAGKRKIDQIRAFFGVRSSNARLDRSEVIGRFNSWISVQDIAQTSQTSSTSVLADFSGRGISTGKDNLCHYVAEEETVILYLASIRPRSGYMDSLNPYLDVKDVYGFIIPDMENVGYQPIKASVMSGIPGDDYVLGYQRRYYEYIASKDEIHGDFKSTLSYWHMARRFDSAPHLNESFLQIDDADGFNRVFALPSQKEKIYADFLIDEKCSRPLSRNIRIGF